jgi:hypothetical protein
MSNKCDAYRRNFGVTRRRFPRAMIGFEGLDGSPRGPVGPGAYSVIPWRRRGVRPGQGQGEDQDPTGWPSVSAAWSWESGAMARPAATMVMAASPRRDRQQPAGDGVGDGGFPSALLSTRRQWSVDNGQSTRTNCPVYDRP